MITHVISMNCVFKKKMKRRTRKRKGGRNKDKKLEGMKKKKNRNILVFKTVVLDLSYALSSYGEL